MTFSFLFTFPLFYTILVVAFYKINHSPWNRNLEIFLHFIALALKTFIYYNVLLNYQHITIYIWIIFFQYYIYTLIYFDRILIRFNEFINTILFSFFFSKYFYRISLKVTLYIVSDVADIVGSFYNVRSTQHTVDYQA